MCGKVRLRKIDRWCEHVAYWLMWCYGIYNNPSAESFARENRTEGRNG